jgi:beta-glucosidase
MFGGNTCIDDLVRLVVSGAIPEERIDKSARLILREKFALGLFDQPMVDPEQVDSVVGQAKFVQAGRQAQAGALTLILNKKGSDDRPVLPLGKVIKVYKENYDSDLSAFAKVVDNPSDAQVIILKIDAPWTPVGRGAMARLFHHGPLEFTTEQHAHIAELAKHAPVIIDLYCDRPAILGKIVNHALAVTCNFGVQPEVLAAVLFGEQSPKGKLPFDLPRDTAAVEARRIDVPFDLRVHVG